MQKKNPFMVEQIISIFLLFIAYNLVLLHIGNVANLKNFQTGATSHLFAYDLIAGICLLIILILWRKNLKISQNNKLVVIMGGACMLSLALLVFVIMIEVKIFAVQISSSGITEAGNLYFISAVSLLLLVMEEKVNKFLEPYLQ